MLILYKAKFHIFLFSCIFWIAGCTTINYDPQADQQLNTISQNLNEQFFTWEALGEGSSKKVEYKPEFYDKTLASLTVLKIRMNATQDINTGRLNSIFDDISGQLIEMRKIHMQNGTITPAYVHGKREAFNAQLSTLITYELSLKAGAGKSDSKEK